MGRGSRKGAGDPDLGVASALVRRDGKLALVGAPAVAGKGRGHTSPRPRTPGSWSIERGLPGCYPDKQARFDPSLSGLPSLCRPARDDSVAHAPLTEPASSEPVRS